MGNLRLLNGQTLGVGQVQFYGRDPTRHRGLLIEMQSHDSGCLRSHGCSEDQYADARKSEQTPEKGSDAHRTVYLPLPFNLTRDLRNKHYGRLIDSSSCDCWVAALRIAPIEDAE